MSISKDTRIKVFSKYNGHCAYCGKEIDYKDMQVDHLIPQRFLALEKHSDLWDKIETFENYMPACRRCNHYKRGNELETFREAISTIPKKLYRDSYIFKVGCDYGFWNSDEFRIIFYFEKRESEVEE